MTKRRSILFFALTIGILTASCRKDKENEPEITRSTTEVTIQKNQIYRLNMGSLCDECGLRISRQPGHAATSKMIVTLVVTDIFYAYEYQPALDYTGTDEVEIEKASGSDGASPHTKFHLHTIKFTIVN